MKYKFFRKLDIEMSFETSAGNYNSLINLLCEIINLLLCTSV